MTHYTTQDFPYGRRFMWGLIPYVVQNSGVGTTNRLVVVTENPKTGSTQLLYPNNEHRSQITLMPYLPEDFPQGTLIDILGMESVYVTEVRRSRSDPEDQFKVLFANGFVQPNKSGTPFLRIAMHPRATRVQDAPVETALFKVGDRVRVKPNIDGLSGVATGTVFYVEKYTKMLSVKVEPSGMSISFPYDNPEWDVEMAVPTWEETIEALPRKSLLKSRDNKRPADFLVKIDTGLWTGFLNGNSMAKVHFPLETLWEVDND